MGCSSGGSEWIGSGCSGSGLSWGSLGLRSRESRESALCLELGRSSELLLLLLGGEATWATPRLLTWESALRCLIISKAWERVLVVWCVATVVILLPVVLLGHISFLECVYVYNSIIVQTTND